MVGKQNNHSLFQNYEESEEGNQTLRDLVEIAILEMQMSIEKELFFVGG